MKPTNRVEFLSLEAVVREGFFQDWNLLVVFLAIRWNRLRYFTLFHFLWNVVLEYFPNAWNLLRFLIKRTHKHLFYNILRRIVVLFLLRIYFFMFCARLWQRKEAISTRGGLLVFQCFNFFFADGQNLLMHGNCIRSLHFDGGGGECPYIIGFKYLSTLRDNCRKFYLL